jgi:hypothetical protein
LTIVVLGATKDVIYIRWISKTPTFLQGELEEEVYMMQPSNFKLNKHSKAI